MSFSEEVKKELYEQIPTSRHCQLSELAAYFWYIGQNTLVEKRFLLLYFTENEKLTKKVFTLIRKAFNIQKDALVEEKNCLKVSDEDAARNILLALKVINNQGVFETVFDSAKVMQLLNRSCCKRAYLRGAFLSGGSLTDPSKGYHMEFVSRTREQAEFIVSLLEDFDIHAGCTVRKDRYISYIKDSSKIVDALNVIEAPLALMNMENERIIKEMRNSINRRVNCEAANINKTVNASTRQVEDIKYIISTKGIDYLPRPLRQMAEVRLENPDSPLKELGELMDPPVGKSGVNHRLRKIGQMADEIRNGYVG